MILFVLKIINIWKNKYKNIIIYLLQNINYKY